MINSLKYSWKRCLELFVGIIEKNNVYTKLFTKMLFFWCLPIQRRYTLFLVHPEPNFTGLGFLDAEMFILVLFARFFSIKASTSEKNLKKC